MTHDIDRRSLSLATADGEMLDADLARPNTPTAAAAIAHPHPLMGGDRHNPVVGAVFAALAAAGIAVVRFDFRGVSLSTGTFDQGRAEQLDVAAALDAAAAEAPGLPLWSIGYSFGAHVALSVDHPGLVGWIGIAAPVAAIGIAPVCGQDLRPVRLIVPTHDQFCSPDQARSTVADWQAARVSEVPMADHFLAGAVHHVADLVVATIVTPDER